MTLLSTLKKKYTEKKDEYKTGEDLDTMRHFPSSVREWDNSIFVYNKNSLPLIPHTSKLAMKLIRSYFSLYNWFRERRIRIKKLRNKHRRLSSSRVYLSKGEFKHTNNKVTITLYTFNRQKSNYLLKLRKRFIRKFSKKRSMKKYLKKSIINNKAKYIYIWKNLSIYKKRNVYAQKYPNCVKIRIRKRARVRRMKFLMKKLKNIKNKTLNALYDSNFEKDYIIHALAKILKMKNIKGVSIYSKRITRYIKRFYRKVRKNYIRKIIKYVYFKQLIYINRSKFNYTYLQYLKNYLQVLFNKNVEFNFINLKKFNLNSDILSESFLIKIKRNRKKLYRLLNKLKNKIRIHKVVYLEDAVPYLNLKIKNKKTLQKYLILDLKYRKFTGFRLEARGRLTKRHTASRSVTKVKYKGNLWNIDSRCGHLSSVLLKGNLDSNLQYTKLKGKTNIGSFGLKGWVSGNT